MLRLSLVAVDGKVVRDLGAIEIVRYGGTADVADYEVRVEDLVVGTVDQYRCANGAWKLAQLAVDQVYAHLLSDSEVATVGAYDQRYPRKALRPYRHDGVCNGLTLAGERCLIRIEDPKAYFCPTHHWQSRFA